MDSVQNEKLLTSKEYNTIAVKLLTDCMYKYNEKEYDLILDKLFIIHLGLCLTSFSLISSKNFISFLRIKTLFLWMGKSSIAWVTIGLPETSIKGLFFW